MKKIFCTALLLLNAMSNLYSQQGEWTWMNGTSVTGSPGVYGTQGVPSPTVTPPAIYEGAHWTDTSGIFWLYGGQSIFGIDFYSDMWKFDPATDQWTWVKGPGGAVAQAPVYGTRVLQHQTIRPEVAAGPREHGPMIITTYGCLPEQIIKWAI
nr:hypothetical protein [Bacteroidota bacterium]